MDSMLRAKIDALFDELENSFDPSTFVLNERVIELQDQINTLQAQCIHNFANGSCIICRMEEHND